jgi:hypothetical protein
VSLAARRWTIASFLLAKGDAAAICIDCGHGGGESYESKAWPEYSGAVSAKLGWPLGPAAKTQQEVWRREFSGGLVLVNARGSADKPKGKTAVVKLAKGVVHYMDPQGAKVAGSITLRSHGAAILLKDSADGPAEVRGPTDGSRGQPLGRVLVGFARTL